MTKTEKDLEDFASKVPSRDRELCGRIAAWNSVEHRAAAGDAQAQQILDNFRNPIARALAIWTVLAVDWRPDSENELYTLVREYLKWRGPEKALEDLEGKSPGNDGDGEAAADKLLEKLRIGPSAPSSEPASLPGPSTNHVAPSAPESPLPPPRRRGRPRNARPGR